jgi:hypothetical protein
MVQDPVPTPGLSAAALKTEVSRATHLDDFGDHEVGDRLGAYLDAVVTDARLSPGGTLGLQAFLHNLLVNR